MTEKPSYEDLEKRIKDLEQAEFERVYERDQAEGALRASKKKYQSLFNNAQVALFRTSIDGKLIEINKQYAGMAGYSTIEDCMAEFNSSDAWAQPDERKELVRIIQEKGFVQDYEAKIIRRDGTPIWIIFSATIFPEQGFMEGSIVEITNRKKAEKALLDSQALYRDLVETAQDLIWQCDTEGLYIYLNPSWESVLGYRVEEMLGRPFSDFQPSAYAVKDRQEFTRLMQGGILTGYETIHLAKDGREIPLAFNAKFLRDVKGNIIGTRGTARDITDRKQKERALLESEELYKSLFENNQSVMLLIDPATSKIVDANPAAISYYGWSRKELTKKKITEINILPKEIVIQEIQKVKNDQKKHFYFNHCLSNGEIRNVEVYSDLITVNEKKLLYSIIHDITEQKQIEKALKEQTQTFNDILENAGDGICVCYNTPEWPHVKFSHWNPSMTSITGYTLEEIKQLGWYQTMYPDPEIQQKAIERMGNMRLGDDIVVEEWPINDKENNKKTLSISTTILKIEEDRTYVLRIMQDISERKRHEEQLLQSHKMESIGTIAGGVAHDFNNILFMIIGNVELALEDIPGWNPSYKNLEAIKSASLRAAGIVKQLLNFSRQADLELKPIGVVAIIEDALKFLRSTIPTTIEIRKHLPDEEIATLGDSIQINQVLVNICTNAAQAMENTGGIFEVNVTSVGLNEEVSDDYPKLPVGNYVKITLSDTGPGIPTKIIDRIFDPYFTTKEFGNGSGMGLAVVHGIVKNHNGYIFVKSEPGNGATFTILFPVIGKKPVIETKTTDGPTYGKEMILFVDDEQTITKMMQRILEKLGYTVETSVNPIDAIEIFRSKPDLFDLVITDMTMPQMTGSKFSKMLKEIRSDIPVIICTGHSSLIDEEKAKELGIDGYVMKPVSMLEIGKTIREVLDR